MTSGIPFASHLISLFPTCPLIPGKRCAALHGLGRLLQTQESEWAVFPVSSSFAICASHLTFQASVFLVNKMMETERLPWKTDLMLGYMVKDLEGPCMETAVYFDDRLCSAFSVLCLWQALVPAGVRMT